MQLLDLNLAREILAAARTIAVIGLSPKETRPSNQVARYLLAAGYRVIPVNPGQERILGLPCYPSLNLVPEAVDIVNIFRRSEEVPPLVAAAIRHRARAVWMQEGVRHPAAAQQARAAGLAVFMNCCIKTVHEQLLLPPGP